jgi:hypothetical protein
MFKQTNFPFFSLMSKMNSFKSKFNNQIESNRESNNAELANQIREETFQQLDERKTLFGEKMKATQELRHAVK